VDRRRSISCGSSCNCTSSGSWTAAIATRSRSRSINVTESAAEPRHNDLNANHTDDTGDRQRIRNGIGHWRRRWSGTNRIDVNDVV
jgi:hypothetical protein